MHALFITPAYPPVPGGGERFARSLALNLTARGVNVTVVTTTAVKESDLWRPEPTHQQSIRFESDGPLKVIRCPLAAMPGGFQALMAWRKLMILVSSLPGDQTRLLSKLAQRVPNIPDISNALDQTKDQIDLVHGFNLSWENALLAGWRYARQVNVPFVVTPFLHTGVIGEDRVLKNSTMDHQMRMLKDAEAILTLTNVEKDMLVDLGCEPERIQKVGSGVDPLPDLDSSDFDWVEEQSKNPYILFVGRNSYDKGCIHTIEAFLSIQGELKDLNLVVIGHPTDDLHRYLQSKDPGLLSSVKILGVIRGSKKHALIRQASLLLLPSRTDSFGIVFIEAWAHGLPVIGARAGGIEEVITDCEDGYLVQFGDIDSIADRIKLLVQNPEIGAALAKNGRKKIETIYNWDFVADLVKSRYQQIALG